MHHATLLLGLTVAAPAAEVSVHDVKRFTDNDHVTLKAKTEMTGFFSLFLMNRIRNERDRSVLSELHRDYQRHSNTVFLYQNLTSLTNPNFKGDDRSKLAALRGLRNRIGEAAYGAGELPPPYPAKYEKDFKAWLAKKFEAGLKTPRAILEAATKARDKEREKKKD